MRSDARVLRTRPMDWEFGDYVIYADESGDHSLTKIDPIYPVFVLCLCVFRKRDYVRRIVPAIQEFKFRWFGHDAVTLHERDIRKQVAPFHHLTNPSDRNRFMTEMGDILAQCRTSIASCVIDKQKLKNEHLFQDNPYAIALHACLEKVSVFLERKTGRARLTHFIFERRGDKEDKELELEFRRFTDGRNKFQRKFSDFEIRMVDKRANSSGLQIADLTARPIGLHAPRPNQANRAFEISITQTHRREGKNSGPHRGHGIPLKIFFIKAKSPGLLRGQTPTGNPQSTCSQDREQTLNRQVPALTHRVDCARESNALPTRGPQKGQRLCGVDAAVVERAARDRAGEHGAIGLRQAFDIGDRGETPGGDDRDRNRPREA